MQLKYVQFRDSIRVNGSAETHLNDKAVLGLELDYRQQAVRFIAKNGTSVGVHLSNVTYWEEKETATRKDTSA